MKNKMFARVVVSAEPHLKGTDAYMDILDKISDLDGDFKMTDYYTNPNNVEEVIVCGKSKLFMEEFALHTPIYLDDGNLEFWTIRENSGYQNR